MHLFNSKHTKDQKKSMQGPTGFFHRIGRDPYVDWSIIFTVTIISIIVAIFIGFLTFEGALARLNLSPTLSLSASVKFNADQLTSLLSTYDARATEHDKLIKAYDGPGDPSL